MEPIIHTRDIKLTPKLRHYVSKKAERIDRYMPDVVEVRVDLSTQNARSSGERQIAQMTLRDARGTILRAEERNGDIFAAVDTVMDKMYRQIERYRGKRKHRRRGMPLNEAVMEPLPIDVPEDDTDEPIIARTKAFAMQPMSAEEAVDQLELLGHDFYMFYNVDTGTTNLVYRRRDKTFGLLQPVLE